MLLPMTADQHTYFLRLESSLPASQYDHKPVEVSFVSDANFKNLSLSFAPMLRAVDNELNQSTVMGFLMALTVVFAALNYNCLGPRLDRLNCPMNQIQSMNSYFIQNTLLK